MSQFQLFHEDRLLGVHPDLVRVVRRAMNAAPFAVCVIEGMRTLERQHQLLAQHATTTLHSRHLDGHAVDLAPMLDNQVSWRWEQYYKWAPVMKAAANQENVPLEWGGDWKTFKDGPHWQLPFKQYP